MRTMIKKDAVCTYRGKETITDGVVTYVPSDGWEHRVGQQCVVLKDTHVEAESVKVRFGGNAPVYALVSSLQIPPEALIDY